MVTYAVVGINNEFNSSDSNNIKNSTFLRLLTVQDILVDKTIEITSQVKSMTTNFL